MPIVLAAIVIAERAFESAHIPKTKTIIGSSIIRVTENGLTFRVSGINGSVVYPWSSLSYRVVNKSGGEAEAILIEDHARKNSKQKIVGYEGMSELVALIEGNAEKP